MSHPYDSISCGVFSLPCVGAKENCQPRKVAAPTCPRGLLGRSTLYGADTRYPGFQRQRSAFLTKIQCAPQAKRTNCTTPKVGPSPCFSAMAHVTQGTRPLKGGMGERGGGQLSGTRGTGRIIDHAIRSERNLDAAFPQGRIGIRPALAEQFAEMMNLTSRLAASCLKHHPGSLS